MNQFNLIKMIDQGEIEKRVSEVSNAIKEMCYPEPLTLLCCLNGAFRVANLLMQSMCGYPFLSIEFAKISSYVGEERKDINVKLFPDKLQNSNVLIVEDIIDSGKTMEELLTLVNNQSPKSVRIFTLLEKPGCFNFNIDFCCFKLPTNSFVVGYGLDYNGYMRDLNSIYAVE